MLDSLVRVSRRVGWEADHTAADPESHEDESRPSRIRSREAMRAVPPSRTGARSKGPPRRRSMFHGPPSGHVPPGYNTNCPERQEGYLPDERFTDRKEPVAASPRENAPPDARLHSRPGQKIRNPQGQTNRRLNSTGEVAVPTVYL